MGLNSCISSELRWGDTTMGDNSRHHRAFTTAVTEHEGWYCWGTIALFPVTVWGFSDVVQNKLWGFYVFGATGWPVWVWHAVPILRIESVCVSTWMLLFVLFSSTISPWLSHKASLNEQVLVVDLSSSPPPPCESEATLTSPSCSLNSVWHHGFMRRINLAYLVHFFMVIIGLGVLGFGYYGLCRGSCHRCCNGTGYCGGSYCFIFHVFRMYSYFWILSCYLANKCMAQALRRLYDLRII